MTPAPIHFAGERLMLDPTGALFWPAQKLLAVADLHLEKGSAAAARGSLLPPWDTRVTLDRLSALLRRWSPAIVVALGDTFHDSRGSHRLDPADAARLRFMASAHRFVWVLGNHDPLPPSGIGGEALDCWQLGPLRFRHQGKPAPARSGQAGSGQAGSGQAGGELCGHHHPKAQVQARGALVSRPCFVVGSQRLMLPALGAYTGGLDVRDPAIAALFPRGGQVFLLGRERLFSFAYAAFHGRASQAPPATATLL
jgi:DNA ligase-associated metallophosphoesterase